MINPEGTETQHNGNYFAALHGDIVLDCLGHIFTVRED